MRFRGGGVGHASTRKATDFFRQDRDIHDMRRATNVESEDDEDCEQTQHTSTHRDRDQHLSRADRDDEEEDYGYNRGQFSDTDKGDLEDEGEEFLDDEFGPEDDGGEVNEFMDNLGYGEM